MRFRQRETAQDVVVCCCILHNMRKSLDAPAKEYSNFEYEFQRQLSEDLRRQLQIVNLQDYIIDNFFN